MTRAVEGTYRGTTTDERREQRRRLLLNAALDIVGTRGRAALTVRGVCEQAKMGPRCFYESFTDLAEALAGRGAGRGAAHRADPRAARYSGGRRHGADRWPG
ncbi:hypothetical protein [Nocardia sp. NPDC059239]|uniref:hypothetical protein n=1 Tax=unclassified Nocardia TaxID=2637762 RepID=UPI00367F040F